MTYDSPYRSDFWASELFIKMPRVEPLPVRWVAARGADSGAQRLFDLWHGLEDGIECQSREVQAWRLKWMRRIELTTIP